MIDIFAITFIISSATVIAYIIICIHEIISMRIIHGRIILSIGVFTTDIVFRSKFKIDIDINTVTVERHIREYFSQNYKYYDAHLLRNLLFVFDDDLYSHSTPNIDSIYYFSKMGKLAVSRFGLIFVERGFKTKIFNEEDFAKMIIHEYLHHLSFKRYKNIDINHMGNCWRTIR